MSMIAPGREALGGLADLLDVAFEGEVVDLEGGGFGGVGAGAGERDGAPVDAVAQGGLHLGLEALEGVGEADGGLEELAVQGADFDEVVGAIALGRGLAEAGHAADHAGESWVKKGERKESTKSGGTGRWLAGRAGGTGRGGGGRRR